MANDYQAHKRYLILNMINHLGPISRTELIALTDYRPASVGAIIKGMIEEGLVVESGYASSGYGRKRVLLDINRNHICALSVSVSANYVSYIMAQINGVVLQRIDEEIDRSLSEDDLAARIVERTQEMLGEFADRIIIGLGICNPPYDPTKYRTDGSLLSGYKQFNEWIQTILAPALEKETSLPVRTFSAVTLPAMAEQRFGVANGVRDFICVELSNGIGASIYVDDHPVAGANGVAGELGHCVIDYSAEKENLCYCGKPGCVESGTAFPALVSDIIAALNKGVFSELNAFYDRRAPLKVEDIRRALDAGDQMCIHYVRRAAERLGIAISNLINLLNPEMIVLYGFMLGLGEVFLNHLENTMRENTLALARGFEIRRSETLERNIPLGAIAELFCAYLKTEDYSWVYQMQHADIPETGDSEA